MIFVTRHTGHSLTFCAGINHVTREVTRDLLCSATINLCTPSFELNENRFRGLGHHVTLCGKADGLTYSASKC